MIQKIKGAQRTQKQAYEHILSELDAGRLGAANSFGCSYVEGKRHCAVGCLFNDAQLADIERRRLNVNFGIRELAHHHIGTENIEAVTGLELFDLILLQRKHDTDYLTVRNDPKNSQFRKFIVAVLKGMK